MTDIPLASEEEDDFLAAEAALGLAEEAQVQQRLRRDAAFAGKVAAWHERFVALAEGIAPVTPRRKLRKSVMRRVFARAPVPVLQRLWVWKGLTLAAVVALAYLAMPLLRPAPPAVPGALYAARMTGQSGAFEIFAVLDTASSSVSLRRVEGAPREGRALELWAILPDAAPVSLGLLDDSDVTHLVLSDTLLAQAENITLAVSDEPAGGAPGNTPTGEVLATGRIVGL